MVHVHAFSVVFDAVAADAFTHKICTKILLPFLYYIAFDVMITTERIKCNNAPA